LDDALSVDPLHPEANFNAALLAFSECGKYPAAFLERLKQGTQFDLGEYRPWLYLACLLLAAGRTQDAFVYYAKAREIAESNEASEVQRLWGLSSEQKLSPVLSPPISGEDFACDSARFYRLIAKAESAICDRRFEDARRYLLMSGDIPRFSRHPKRQRIVLQLEG
jgi:hypothetical protein